MKNKLLYIVLLPKNIILNFYLLPLKSAIKMPLYFGKNAKVKVHGTKFNKIEIKNPKFKNIIIGIGGSYRLGANNQTYIELFNNSKLIFNSKANIGRGTQIICGENACISIGDNFFCNANCIINSSDNIKIGNNTIVGWNCEMLSFDGHKIEKNKEDNNKNRGIEIGNNTWISANVTLLKGTIINDNSVVATRSCISKKFDRKNLLLGGNNKVLRENIKWEI